MKPDWILVANASQARLLEHEPGAPLTVVQAFHHPESRQRSSELGDDARGREASDRHQGATAFEAHVEPQRKEHERFSLELADYLEQAAQSERFRTLQLWASNPFLGLLKNHLGEATRRALSAAHASDLSALGLAEIEARLGLAGR